MRKAPSLALVTVAALPMAAFLPAAFAEDPSKPDTRLDRQSLRAQQNVLTPQEQRRGEDRLDSIDRKAETDPRAAREMQRIYDADQSLSTINRPIPNPNEGK
jgi:hypothetical protein